MLLLDLLSTHCFACFGALAAIKARLNIWQTVVAAILTSTGGGTVREMVLASEIIFWLENLQYLVAIALAIPLSVLLSKASSFPPVMTRVVEATGTTVFIVVGILAAMHSGHELPGCIVAGIMTGIGGGLLRQLILRTGFDSCQNALNFAMALFTAWSAALLAIRGLDPVLIVLVLCLLYLLLLELIHKLLKRVREMKQLSPDSSVCFRPPGRTFENM